MTAVAFMLNSFTSVAEQAAQNTPENASPSMDFLEFLADMEQVNGEWVSPVSLPESANDAHLSADKQVLAEQDATQASSAKSTNVQKVDLQQEQPK